MRHYSLSNRYLTFLLIQRRADWGQRLGRFRCQFDDAQFQWDANIARWYRVSIGRRPVAAIFVASASQLGDDPRRCLKERYKFGLNGLCWRIFLFPFLISFFDKSTVVDLVILFTASLVLESFLLRGFITSFFFLKIIYSFFLFLLIIKKNSWCYQWYHWMC